MCTSFANAPMSPGVTEDPTPPKDDPDGAAELPEVLTSLLLLALDILKGKQRYAASACVLELFFVVPNTPSLGIL